MCGRERGGRDGGREGTEGGRKSEGGIGRGGARGVRRQEED